MADQGFDEVAVQLYTGDPARFVAGRTAAVEQARVAGERDLAAALGRLRRPTLSAWAVNLLVSAAGGGVSELLALGEELRAAQQHLQGDRMRRLAQRRRELVAGLVSRAARLAADGGHPLGGTALIEVEQTLGAALADPESAEAVRAGRLARPLEHVGLGPQPLVAAPLTSPDLASRTDASRTDSSQPAPLPAEDGVAREDEMARHRRRSEERMARELARAYQELTEATARAERADQQVQEAAERCADVQRRLSDLQRESDRGQEEHAQLQRRARSAARVRDEAQRRLRRLTERREQRQVAP